MLAVLAAVLLAGPGGCTPPPPCTLGSGPLAVCSNLGDVAAVAVAVVKDPTELLPNTDTGAKVVLATPTSAVLHASSAVPDKVLPPEPGPGGCTPPPPCTLGSGPLAAGSNLSDVVAAGAVAVVKTPTELLPKTDTGVAVVLATSTSAVLHAAGAVPVPDKALPPESGLLRSVIRIQHYCGNPCLLR